MEDVNFFIPFTEFHLSKSKQSILGAFGVFWLLILLTDKSFQVTISTSEADIVTVVHLKPSFENKN